MSIGFNYSEILNLEVHDYEDWLVVASIQRDKKDYSLLASTFNNLVEKPANKLNTLSNKINMAFGINPFKPKKEEIEKTKEAMKRGVSF